MVDYGVRQVCKPCALDKLVRIKTYGMMSTQLAVYTVELR